MNQQPKDYCVVRFAETQQSQERRRFHCFHTRCEQEFGKGGGDIFDFIERQEKTTKAESIKIAKRILGEEARSESEQQLKKSEGQDLRSSASTVLTQSVFITEDPSELYYKKDELEIIVLGGINIFGGLDKLRVTLKIIKDRLSLRHNLDLYYDDQLQKLAKKLAERLEISSTIATSSLNELTDQLEHYRIDERKRQTEQKKLPPLTVSQVEEAKSLLKDTHLIATTSRLLGESGIIGEINNRLSLFIIYASRKRRNPLHVICLGASGTGKTYLQDKVSKLIPEDEKFSFTASTENAFYYLKEDELKHKLVIIEDLDGADNMLYSLRELQTKQRIDKIVPLKDQTGNDINTKRLEVHGPICLSSTTTKERLYEDNANRCLLLYLDNSNEQEERIMDYQRQLSAGLIDETDQQKVIDQLTNVQRVLENVRVINPYAPKLKIPQRCLKPLRTNAHYLDFIETVTYYHQYQRERKVNQDTGEEYIETTIEDIRVANELLKPILLDKSDELTKVLRDFFEGLKRWLKTEKKQSFYAKEYRDHTRMYRMKVNRYFADLEGNGLIKRIGGNRKVGYEYQVTDWNDYEQLQEGVSILDSLLKELEYNNKAAVGSVTEV